MPMEKLEDFALQNSGSDYCKYCTDEQGKLLPWEQILKVNADYFKDSQGITEVASVKMATDLLRAQPAWKI